MVKRFRKSLALVMAVFMAVSVMNVASFCVDAADNSFALYEANIYELTVNTGSNTNAGTDADVYVELTEAGGETLTVNLSDIHPDANAFEKEDSTTFKINAPDSFKSVKAVKFYIDVNWYAYIGCGWYLESFKLEKVLGVNTGEVIEKTVEQWVEEDEPYSTESDLYEVQIKTVDDKNAGTNLTVYLTLTDTSGKTVKKNLSHIYPKGDAFEKGDDVTIHFNVPDDFGKLESVTLELTGSDNIFIGPGCGWFLGYIRVEKIQGTNNVGDKIEKTPNMWFETDEQFDGVTFTN